MVTECLLVRHGEIQANVDKLWHGTTDSDLTQSGEQQIHRLGHHIHSTYPNISKVYSSPLKRTLRTANAVAEGLNSTANPVNGLIEFGVGEWEGLSYEVIASEHMFFDKIGSDQDFKPHLGESVNEVAHRVHEAFFKLIDQHRGERIALVGHGAAFAILMTRLLENQHYPFFHHHMSNTGISLLEIDESNKVQRSIFDDTNHLGTEG